MVQLKSPKRAGEQGFTLVELAIVMIIIGLLIGGILKGQELIGNARVTATVSQIKSIDAAASTFRDMYDAFPGDMVNAFGANGRLPNCTAAPCANGSGNGRIAETPAAANALTDEAVNFWIHLSVTDLLGGIDRQNNLAWGQALPNAEVGGGYTIGYATGVGNLTGNIGAVGVSGGHYLSMRADPAVAIAASNANASLTASQAARIDRKMDDGAPSSGTVIAAGAAASNTACAINVTDYAEGNDGLECQLYVRIQQ